MRFADKEPGIHPQPDKDSSDTETYYQGRVDYRCLVLGIDEIWDNSGGRWCCCCLIKTGTRGRLPCWGHCCQFDGQYVMGSEEARLKALNLTHS